jgi:hypothetical protein
MKFIAFLTVLFSTSALSHSWDEPWHDDVSRSATSLAFYKVTQNYESHVELKLIKHLAGLKTSETLTTSGYYLYDLASSSSGSDEHGIGLQNDQQVYVYLMADGQKYKLATPTAGYDEITEDGSVAATYRHSLHKTKIDRTTYENTQTCIFDIAHGKDCPERVISKYILEPLSLRVAELSPEATQEDYDLFFKQHVALETAFLINYSLPPDIIDKFLLSRFFHVQISAVRALSVSNDENKTAKLSSFIELDENTDIAKVMAVIMLDRLNADDQVEFLEGILEESSEANVHLGANIMDPRVSTWYPTSVKAAITWFVDKNKSLNNPLKGDHEKI